MQSGRGYNVFYLFVSVSKSIRQVFAKLTAVVHYGTDEGFTFGVKGQSSR